MGSIPYLTFSRSLVMPEPTPCPNCAQRISDKYCAACGEKRFEPEDLTLHHFAEHAVEAFTHADGKIFATLRSLVLRPGEMSADYIRGRRKPYLAPLGLFLICNVIYFLVQPWVGWDTLSSTLDTDLHFSHFQRWAEPMVNAKLVAAKTTLETYTPVFNHAAVVRGKSLAILLVPLYAAVVALLQFRPRRPVVTHIIFALHYVSYFLLALVVSLTFATVVIQQAAALGHPLSYGIRDSGSAVPLLVLTGLYLYPALRRVYGDPRWLLALKTLILVAALIPVLAVYRFVLFLITLWTT